MQHAVGRQRAVEGVDGLRRYAVHEGECIKRPASPS
jgi:hypothetical protein